MDALKVLFLEDGAQTAARVASWLAEIIASARARPWNLAIYDFHLEGEAADILIGALRERERAGVRLRIVYNAPSVIPRRDVVAEPAHPAATEAFLSAHGLEGRRVGDASGQNLMHHKFLLVDAGTPGARLWTGSANLTDAAFTRQENNLLDITSPALVNAYAAVFEELWTTRDIAGSGAYDDETAVVRYGAEDALVEVRFAPGRGRAIDHEVAERISQARREVTIASVVLTSGHILGALAGVARRGIALSGIVDAQMRSIVEGWRRSPESGWKADTFEEIARYGALREKQSSRAWPAGPHDYMHDKVIVVDDTVITGSYKPLPPRRVERRERPLHREPGARLRVPRARPPARGALPAQPLSDGCHRRSKRYPIRLTAPKIPSPSSDAESTAAKSRSVRSCRYAVSTVIPRPDASSEKPATNSPTMAPITASPPATRSPVTISGSAAGIESFTSVASLPAP